LCSEKKVAAVEKSQQIFLVLLRHSNPKNLNLLARANNRAVRLLLRAGAGLDRGAGRQ
jgi:hypothetical protein